MFLRVEVDRGLIYDRSLLVDDQKNGKKKTSALKSLEYRLRNILLANPLGPYDGIQPRACLRKIRLQEDGVHVALAHNATVKVKKLGEGADGKDFSRSIFSHDFEDGDDKDLADYYTQPLQRVLGLEPLPPVCGSGSSKVLISLRYREKATIVSPDDGDIVRHLNAGSDGENLLSQLWLPSRDSLVLAGSSGGLRVIGLDEDLDDPQLFDIPAGLPEEDSTFKWAQLFSSGRDMCFRVATRKTVALYDLRMAEGPARTLFQAGEAGGMDLLGAACPIESDDLFLFEKAALSENMNMFLCSCSDQVFLVDERHSKTPVKTWHHSLETTPTEICSVTRSNEKIFAISSNTGVAVMTVDGASTIKMTPRAEVSKIWPVTSLTAQRMLELPLSGMCFTGIDGNGTVSLLAANAGGSVFCADLEMSPSDEPSADESSSVPSEKADALKKWVEVWEEEMEDISRVFPKKFVATKIYQREALPTEPSDRVYSLPHVRQRPSKKAKQSPARKVARKDGHQDSFAGVFKACPQLLPIDPTLHSDNAGDRVRRILEGENVFSIDISSGSEDDIASESEASNRFVDMMQKRRLKRSNSLESSEAQNLTTQEFEEGLERGDREAPITSTQEQPVGDAWFGEPLADVSTMLPLSASQLAPMSVDASVLSVRKKSKEKRSRMGF